ncbi:GNAT family N-acetyltransferase [Abyssalbus ytuae]|uniref:GNAT family N-acetyltransferase n=1 Tax=Abyssalbus ytuae TaxID=2926907 RepID=A0A9E7D3H2_9FLAO|nr:GNAT family N-acetyltransferase [Abyssalbus ytuae]UOB19313.1 GNAT family N-acetyltransferase [Abyssalbus ytuae]
MNILIAQKDQLPIIHQLAHIIWPPTFKEILSPQQIDYMLHMMYSPESLLKQLENGHHFIIAEQDGKYSGYASYEFNYKNELKTKIHKIYVLPETQGQGIGKTLIDYIENESIKKEMGLLTLNVNRYNKAVGFYEKTGFKTTGVEDIDIGNGFLMEDFIMEKPVSKTN